MTDDPPVEELVAAVLEGPSADEAAVSRLRHKLEAWARATVAGTRTQLARDFVEEAPGEVIRRCIESYDGSQPAEAWCRTVLRNLWRDRLRRSRTRLPAAGEMVERVAGPVRPDPQGGERLQRWAGELRDALDGVAWAPARSVDQYAALLLQLRLALAAAVVRGGHFPEGLSSVAAGLLPWREDEVERRVRRELATLGEVWSRLGPRLDALDAVPETDHVLEALEEASGGAGVSASTWYQWTRRARKRLRESITGEAYDRLFAGLLQDRGRGAGAAEDRGREGGS